jgi:tetratricopeptide (TPR) repeat protein
LGQQLERAKLHPELNWVQWSKAIEAYREALRIEPNFAEAWYYCGVAHAKSGNRVAALEAVNELRKYDPQKADKLFDLIIKP